MNYSYNLQKLIELETINHISGTDDNYNGSDHDNNVPEIDEDIKGNTMNINDIETEINTLLDFFSLDIKDNDELLPNDINNNTPIFALINDTALKMYGIEYNSNRKDIMMHVGSHEYDINCITINE
eukprot:449574_1